MEIAGRDGDDGDDWDRYRAWLADNRLSDVESTSMGAEPGCTCHNGLAARCPDAHQFAHLVAFKIGRMLEVLLQAGAWNLTATHLEFWREPVDSDFLRALIKYRLLVRKEARN